MVLALYRSDPTGCCLHVVLDDGNSGASALALCAGNAERARHATCAWIAQQLGTLTVDQRRRFIR
jgi:hypothetical protein